TRQANSPRILETVQCGNPKTTLLQS
ncbi:hypothetical protein, partial [uncultured Gammaproteobacteria bacterium]